MEIKTLHYAGSTYPTSPLRCHGVARRAAALQGDYLRKARALDQRFLHTPANARGPIEAKLRGFGEIKGLVFGAWSEASPDVHSLVSEAARVGSLHLNGNGKPPEEMAAHIAASLRRQWGMAAQCSNARLLLDRLQLVGRGAAEAAARRSCSRAAFDAPRIWRSRRLPPL